MKLVVLVLLAGLTGCGWTEGQQEAFMNECTKGVDRGIRSTGGSPDDQHIKNVCACAFEKVKERWSYTEFIELTPEENMLDEFLVECNSEE